MQNERIESLQKEVNKLHIQLDQQRMIERDLQGKADKNRERADNLEFVVHKGKDSERKEMIELQIKLSQVEQELSIKEDMNNK